MILGQTAAGLFIAGTMLGDGVVPTLMGTGVAFIAVCVYLTLWLWLDRYDPEPPWLLMSAFLWGAGVAALVAGLVNGVAAASINVLLGSGGSSLAAVVSAPFIEECMKGLGVVIILVFMRHEFDGVLDGITYAGVIGLGFAAVENVEYYARAFVSHGSNGLAVVFVLRGLFTPFMHALFTSMIGIGCGFARGAKSGSQRAVYIFIGYLCAVTLHMLHNLTAELSLFSAYYLFVELPLFIALVVFALRVNASEMQIVRTMLRSETFSGVITPQQLIILGSSSKRNMWVAAAARNRTVHSNRQTFLHVAHQLAMNLYHLSLSTSVPEKSEYLEEINSLRAEAVQLQSAI